MKVVAATKNKSAPHGHRPYHRPDCSHVKRVGSTWETANDNWTLYPSCAAAQADGRRPCDRCAPAD